MRSTERVMLRAHAKLTRSLRITGVRTDGYHLIDAEMVSLDLHDVLSVDPTRSGLAATGTFAEGMPLDATNLVARALRSVGRTAHVTIDKQIPHGGGLGGGSTDAAAILRWGGGDIGTSEPGSGVVESGAPRSGAPRSGAPRSGALERAALLGADVPFCLVGGRARVTGIGEVVEPLPFVEVDITLVIPPLAVSTPAAYRAWDDLGGPTADGKNDLEPAALVVEPRLARWRDLIGERIGTAPILAGSGATWFAEGTHGDALADLIDEGAMVVVARTVPMDVAGS